MKAKATKLSLQNSCHICATPSPSYWALSECGHSYCSLCCLRLRILYKNNKCPLCNKDSGLKTIIIKHPQNFSFSSSFSKMATTFDANLSLYFESEEVMKMSLQPSLIKCPKCYLTFDSISILKGHLSLIHSGCVFCDICLKFKKVFPQEQKTFPSNDSLKEHQKGNGVDSHPSCNICNILFYGEDELDEHNRLMHEQCHICSKINQRRLQNLIPDKQKALKGDAKLLKFYKGYEQLAIHFEKEHYPCMEEVCLGMKFVIFEEELELQAHMSQVHGKKSNRPIKLDISFFNKSLSSNQLPSGPSSRSSNTNTIGSTNVTSVTSAKNSTNATNNTTMAITKAETREEFSRNLKLSYPFIKDSFIRELLSELYLFIDGKKKKICAYGGAGGASHWGGSTKNILALDIIITLEDGISKMSFTTDPTLILKDICLRLSNLIEEEKKRTEFLSSLNEHLRKLESFPSLQSTFNNFPSSITMQQPKVIKLVSSTSSSSKSNTKDVLMGKSFGHGNKRPNLFKNSFKNETKNNNAASNAAIIDGGKIIEDEKNIFEEGENIFLNVRDLSSSLNIGLGIDNHGVIDDVEDGSSSSTIRKGAKKKGSSKKGQILYKWG